MPQSMQGRSYYTNHDFPSFPFRAPWACLGHKAVMGTRQDPARRLSDVEGEETRVVADRFGWAVQGDPSLFEDIGAVGEGQAALDVLLDHQHRDATLVHAGQRLVEAVDHDRRKAERDLVEDGE